MAMVVENTKGTRIYGTGFYNWFGGEQGPLFSITTSPDINTFGINTHGCGGVVLVGQDTINNVTSPGVNQWFTVGYVANTRPTA